MDVSQYLDIFLDETKEHLQNLNTQILALEQDSENMDTINEIFRAAHSLKGMAGTMGYKRMQTLTHDMENVFSEVRTGNIKVNAPMIDTLFQCLDALEDYLACIQENADEGDNDNEPLIKELNRILNSKGKEEDAAPSQEEEAPAKEAAPTATHWNNVECTSEDKQQIKDAVEKGKNVYGLTVIVQEACLLKAARAFLVFKAVEEIGEIVSTQPSSQEIEDEHFELDFSMIVTSERQLDDVIDAVKKVSEIADAVGDIYFLKDEAQPEETDAAVPAVAQTTQPEVVKKSEKLQTVERPAAKQPEKKTAAKQQMNRTVRVDIEKLDVLMNLVSELIIAKNSLVSSATGVAGTDNNTGFNEQIEYLESVTTNLHESVMKVRMVPIESVVNKFPRMIRDLSKKLNKQMELYMTGEETELDRTVVDEIGDPLMHLLRNSADHGLESTETRVARGKTPVGSIFLDAYQDGNNVVIEVRDDGNGIDADAVRMKAVEREFLTEEQAASAADEDIISLLFEPGFSTAKQVSDVSGRGVGLDVVKSKIESLSGEVEVKTKLGEGSTFIIRLPLTLAIIQALMVVVGGEKYAISLGGIQTIEDVDPKEIKTVQSKEVIHLRGSVIPLIRLEEVLDIESKREPDENMVVVIVKKGDKLAGLVIDELIGQQEIVIKSMGKYINKCKFISGATILGDGEIALILDANALI